MTWELERTRAVFGTDDIWPYGVAANRKTLEKLVEYLYDQHITPCKLAVEDLFAPETIDTFRI
jgi:4,5-dihydroxyphthalate decarboxylase